MLDFPPSASRATRALVAAALLLFATSAYAAPAADTCARAEGLRATPVRRGLRAPVFVTPPPGGPRPVGE